MKSLIDNLLITCNEIVDMSQNAPGNVLWTVSINFVNKKETCKMDYCILSTILLGIMCLFLLVVIAINC